MFTDQAIEDVDIVLSEPSDLAVIEKYLVAE